jgi:hypothetical protein
MNNPIAPKIEVELLKFADGLAHIRKCVVQGTMTEDEAHDLKNKLVGVYARHIARVIEEDEYPDADSTMPEGGALLVEFGVEPLTAKHLAAECSLDDIEGWIAYANSAKSLSNPPGLVVSRLKAGVPPPKVVSPEARQRQRYLGQYADYIQT